MTEDRRQVLEMLSAGQITADEADRLITALDAPQPALATRTAAAPRYLRVVADVDDDEDGPLKINVRVPFQLLRAGVKLASLIPVQAQESVNTALRERGMSFDLSQIKPENLNELIDGLTDLTVDVDQQNVNLKVRIFCE